RQHCQTSEERRRNLGAEARVPRYSKWDLKDVEQQVMVHIVFGVERCEWKPGKLWKMSALDRCPERLRPFDVVVAVEVATADRGGRELKSPKNKADDNGAGDKLKNSYARLGLKPGGGCHQSLK